MNKRFARSLLVIAIILALSVIAVADTIRLKDGSVIRGQIISFRDQQFTVVIGSGSRGRRSTMTIYTEDVESIEFDAATSNVTTTRNETATNPGETNRPTPPPSQQQQPPTRSTSNEPRISNTGTSNTTSNTSTPPRTSAPTSTASQPKFFQINVRVRADNTANGWTNSGLVVRRGQRIRISATGRASLGQGRFSTPAGVTRITDANKLMRDEPTGALIAVIGDDNDDFILIGEKGEFTARRDGVLFLGINEGNLNDNTGAYDAVVEAEAISGNKGN